MFTTDRVPAKYDQIKIRKVPDMDAAFLALSLSVTLTPELADQLGHNVLPSMFRETAGPKNRKPNERYEPNPDVLEVGFSFSVDPQVVQVFPVEDPTIASILQLAPVDVSKLKASREGSSLVKLKFEASFELSDPAVLYKVVSILGENLFLTWDPMQRPMDFDAVPPTSTSTRVPASKSVN